MISSRTLERVNQGKCLDDLARLAFQCEKLGISTEGPESDKSKIINDLHRGVYFKLSGERTGIRKWANGNRAQIDIALCDEMLDFVALFETCCMVWDPREYPVLFFNVAANILTRLPEGYPDIPQMALVRSLRNIIVGWRSLGI